MQKHGVYEVTVEPMTCRRENSYKPLKVKQVSLFKKEQTQMILNKIKLTTIDTLNANHLSMGVIDITYKKIGHFKKQLGSETVECDMRILPNLETIGDYLIKGSFGGFKHADKMIDKVKDHPKQSVIMAFSAEEFLLSDRDHFLSNTNR